MVRQRQPLATRPPRQRNNPVTRAPRQRKTAATPRAPRQRKTAATPRAPRQRKTAAVPRVPRQRKTAAVPRVPRQRKTAATPRAPRQRKTVAVPRVPRQRKTAAPLSPHAWATLHRVYADVDRAGSFAGAAALRRAAEREGLRLTQRQVAEFLRSEPAHGIHHLQRVRFKRRRVISFDINWLWELDTAFMLKFARHNNGYAYLLVKIDVLSKQLDVEPMRTKTSAETVAALNRICDRLGTRPEHIACDAGTEFEAGEFMGWAAAHRIPIYFVRYSAHGAANVERVIRKLKARIYRYLTHVNRYKPEKKRNYRYVHVLPKIVSAYNHSWHRSIGCAPVDVNEANVEQIRDRLYPAEERFAVPTSYRYALGDKVRHAEPRGDFHRGFLPQFSEEVYVIKKQLKTLPRTYKLARLDGGEITGRYYEWQLLPFVVNQYLPGAARDALLTEQGLEEEAVEDSD